MMRRVWHGTRIGALLVTSALLPGCAEINLLSHFAKQSNGDPAPTQQGATNPAYKIGKAYQVAGVWYYPREDFDYDESGIGSWYGPTFHGKLTANGEVFDENQVSAAHKTLPLPSVVRVTNLENGRSLVIRINDRGPFVNGRVIDLSRRAAQLLGYEGKGTAKVRVQVMAEESRALAGKLKRDVAGEPQMAIAAPRESVTAESLPPPPGAKGTTRPTTTMGSTGSASGVQRGSAAADAAERTLAAQQVQQVPVHATNLFVQAGAFSRHDNAVRLHARLNGLGSAQIQQVSVKGQMLFRVRLGPIGSVEDADRLLDAVIATGQPDARVVVD
ncbi:MAG: septal ring lytic transglycosylase RlpA family protein [Magnetospirillum sp.]|nr:septal ring lytic transglycosylase RlpA family protein [Magnetospirillum sp.]